MKFLIWAMAILIVSVTLSFAKETTINSPKKNISTKHAFDKAISIEGNFSLDRFGNIIDKEEGTIDIIGPDRSFSDAIKVDADKETVSRNQK